MWGENKFFVPFILFYLIHQLYKGNPVFGSLCKINSRPGTSQKSVLQKVLYIFKYDPLSKHTVLILMQQVASLIRHTLIVNNQLFIFYLLFLLFFAPTTCVLISPAGLWDLSYLRVNIWSPETHYLCGSCGLEGSLGRTLEWLTVL